MPLGEELHACRQAPTVSNLRSAAEATKGLGPRALGESMQKGD